MAHNVNKLGLERAMQVVGKKAWQGNVEWWNMQESSECSQQPSIVNSRQGQGGKKYAQGNAARNDGCECDSKKYRPLQRHEAEWQESQECQGQEGKEWPDSWTQNQARSHSAAVRNRGGTCRSSWRQ